MAQSYMNIMMFLLTTVFYYLALKPTLTYEQLNDVEQYNNYIQSNYVYLGIYLLLVMVVQFTVNTSILSNTCGGKLTENLGAAGVLTFIPWLLIFGVIIIVLLLYPGFKAVFADVIGYFYVSGDANNLITELLVNRDLNASLENTDQSINPDAKKKLEDAADAIVKICGNTSILINQIVPENFDSYWEILKPLMKPQFQEDISKKSQLFDIVITRDNIGEAMWYVYTGILLTSIVQLKITTRGCKSSPATMEKNYQAYLKKEKESQAEVDRAESTVYTV